MSQSCQKLIPASSSDLYDIDINDISKEIALILCFFFFFAPAVMHLTIKFYLKHALLYKKKLSCDESTAIQELEALPSPPKVHISCHSIKYSVPMNKESLKKLGKPKGTELELLKGITVGFRAGTLNAIMGPSGCGKSTLLDILADRKQDGIITGKITLNGYARDKFFRRASSYVLQFDALFPYLTVRETFLFAAEFRLDYCNDLKIIRVEKIMKQLDLMRVADTIIGDDNDPQCRGISGGQRRRVTVGIELLSSPSILFLDEPTTGLDAFDSLKLVTVLRNLSDSGCTIICTIHQPRVEIFNQFDNLMLMVEGETAYYGPITNIPTYLKSIEFPINKDVNIGDFIVDLTYSKDDTEASFNESDISGKSSPQLLVDEYANSIIRQENEHFVNEIESSCVMTNGIEEELSNVGDFYKKDPTIYQNSRFSIQYANPIHRQLFTLSRRASLNSARNPTNRASLLINSAQFLFFGLLWLGAKTGSLPSFLPSFAEKSLDARTTSGFLYTMVNIICVFEVDVIAEAFTQKEVFLREHASGTYSVYAYHFFWATKLGWRAIRNGVIYTILSYFLSNLSLTWIQFFIFMLYMCVLSTCGSGIALLLVVAVPDVRGAADIHNSVLGFMGTFAGFFLLPQLIPGFLKYYTYYLSFYHYAYEGLIWNEYALDHGGFNESKRFLGDVFTVDCNLNMWSNLLVLLIYPFLFHIIAACITAYRTRPRSYWENRQNREERLDSYCLLDENK